MSLELNLTNKTNTTNTVKFPLFSDIGGYEYQKEEARKIARFFNNYDEYISKGARLCHGVCFFGEPGTGKSMFAKAIANETGVPVFSFTTDNLSQNNNNITSFIKDLFAKAKDAAPSILFIDELDRLVNCQAEYRKQETDKQLEVLRALLTEIDACQDDGVLVIATANTNISLIPAALVRNGRIEKHIEVSAPTVEDREDIINIYLSKSEIFKNIDKKDIASYTSGFTGSDISALVNDVLINCITEEKFAEFNDFLEPIEAIRSSSIKRKSNKDNSPSIYHEIGHFIADYVLNKKIGMINVVPNYSCNGKYVRVDRTNPQEMDSMSYKDMRNECIVAVSGLVATKVFLGENYMGAGGDLHKVATMFLQMATNGLLGGKLAAVSHLGSMDYDSPFKDFNSALSGELDTFINEVSRESEKILTKNKPLVDALFLELKKKSVLTHVELEQIVNSVTNN